MPASDPRVPVERIRAAMRDALRRVSSHTIADDVGMSAPAIRDFARGSSPREVNLRKLTFWFHRYQAAEKPVELDGRTAAAMLALLLEWVPEEERDAAREGFYAWVDGLSGGTGEPPAWTREMREL